MGINFFYLAVVSILLSGCFTKSEPIILPESISVRKQIDKIDSKKEEIQIQEENKQKQKKCEEYTKMMRHAVNYIVTEFEEGYFIQKDIVGAKAQLFLIKNQSQNLFAKNINDANRSYNKYYKLAKEAKCDFNFFEISPLDKVENTMKVLENESSL